MWNVRTKILLPQIGLLLLVSLLLGTSAYVLMVDSLERIQREHLLYVAEDWVQHIRMELDNQKAMLEQIARGEALEVYRHTLNEGMLSDYLNGFMGGFPVLSYVNMDGMEELKLIEGEKSGETRDISRSELFEEAIWTPNRVFVDVSWKQETGSPPGVEFAYCRENFGEFEGVLVGRVPLARLAGRFLEYRLGETGFLALTDADGQYLLHPQTGKILTDMRISGDLSEDIRSRAGAFESGFGRAAVEGVQMHVAYAPMQELHCVVFACLPDREFLAGAKTMKNMFVVVSLIVLGFGLLVSLAMASAITTPVLRLARTARQISNGHLSERTELTSRDEFGIMARAFDTMIDNLQTALVARDKEIAERKRVEEALRRSEAQIRTILDASVDMIMHVDTHMQIVWANRKAAGIVNKSPEQLIGHTCHKFFQNSDEPCAGCPCARALETGKIEHGIMHQPAMDVVGESYWEDYGIPVRDEHDQIVGLIEIARDVTERFKAEEALRRAKEDWENTFDAITDMVMILDSERRIVRVNRAAADAFGTAKAGLAGRMCVEVMHGKGHPIQACPLALTSRTLKPQTKEITSEALQGRTFICSTSPILNQDGALTGYTHTLKDVTEFRRLEAQLQEVQKMEAIGTLAGGIAHDFNNILQALSGYVELLLAKKETDAPDRRYLAPMADAVERARDLVQRLLLFGRRVENEMRPLNLNAEVMQVHKLLERTIPKMITIQLDLAGDLKPVNADPVKVEQIMMNLAVNARDAMPEGGRLTFRTENVFVDGALGTLLPGVATGEYTVLTVTDTGLGMTETNRKRIFEPFFTTKETGKGTGLGLAIVYSIVKSHGGYIHLQSAPGRGTTFKIYFPVLEGGDGLDPAAPKTERRPPKGTETVLLVDDEKSLLDVGRSMLEGHGYTCIVADSGEKAVEIYRREKDRVSLVILDLGMPGMGGRRCIEELLRNDPAVKVIVASGYGEQAGVEEILQAGAAAFVQKPYRFTDLLNTVREVLDGPDAS